MPVVNINNVFLNYHSLEGETLALNDINLSVEKGQFIAIVGPSGCGKSTLLSLIAGLLMPSSGEIKVMDQLVTKPQTTTGYMLQRDHLFSWRTIWQNVILGLEVRNQLTEENIAYVEKLLNDYGLARFKNHYPNQLSGGMRQKVALIRTLALEPELLLLDEPFSALDYQTRLSLGDEISEIIRNENKTAILVTHDISEAISMADQVIIFSSRPARIKQIVDISLTQKKPLERRNEVGFKDYFDTIWKEIDVYEHQ